MKDKCLNDFQKRFVIELEAKVAEEGIHSQDVDLIFTIYARSLYKSRTRHQHIYAMCRALNEYYSGCVGYRRAVKIWRDRSRAGEVLAMPKDVDLPGL